MIWYNKEILLINQPSDTTSLVKATYNPPSEDPSIPLIMIELCIRRSNGDTTTKILYEHNPKMMLRESPDKEDIMAKYATNLQKSLKKASSYDFLLLFPSP